MYFQLWQIAALVILFFVLIYVFYKVGKKVGEAIANSSWNRQLPSLRRDIANSSRSIIKGQVSEQFAPYFPDFPFKPNECKFLGNPVDFVVFNNIDSDEDCSVVFVEIKSGKAGLNKHERNIKRAINDKKVFWYEYRVDV